MQPDLRFTPLAPWLRSTFGRPVRRVALDAGSTCPNRDGTKGLGGCTYCDVEGSGTGALKTGLDLERQLLSGLERIRRGQPDAGAIAYLQSYTNTYVDEDRLRAVLAVIEPHVGEAVVAISVATRPDTLDAAALAILAELAERVPVWVEIGLETANDNVLTAINRLHTLAEFHATVERIRSAGLLTIAHAILGLPGDGREGAQRTASELARAGVEGVKVHHLMVLKRTQMAAQWQRGELDILDHSTYVDWLTDFVERLHPEQVLHRVTGESPPEKLLAPHWEVHKNAVRDLLTRELERRDSRQGSRSPARQPR
jgi:radical SAM protein (TIGR01212 family)